MKPSRVYWLTKRNGDDLAMDVSELVASRLGTAIHDSIEKIETPNVHKEERVFKKLEINGVTYTVAGKYDILTEQNGKWVLRDIKTTSVWAWIFGGKDEDYRKQLSIYRWLLSDKHDVEDAAYIDFFFTDWQSMKAKTEENYPSQRIAPGYKIDLLTLEETEAYVRERLLEIFSQAEVPDSMLPECTDEELWADEDTYAVKKYDAKRATKVCSSKEEAVQYIADKKMTDVRIEFRKGKVKRCKYCPAAPFCSQFFELDQQGLIDKF